MTEVKYSQCPVCKAVEGNVGGIYRIRHNSLCEAVQILSTRIAYLEKKLVEGGLLPEFRP